MEMKVKMNPETAHIHTAARKYDSFVVDFLCLLLLFFLGASSSRSRERCVGNTSESYATMQRTLKKSRILRRNVAEKKKEQSGTKERTDAKCNNK